LVPSNPSRRADIPVHPESAPGGPDPQGSEYLASGLGGGTGKSALLQPQEAHGANAVPDPPETNPETKRGTRARYRPGFPTLVRLHRRQPVGCVNAAASG